jgi:hypothetical protein
MNGVSVVSFLFLVAMIIFVYWDAFYIARHLAANFGTNLAVLI